MMYRVRHVACASLGLLVLLPFFILVALAVRLVSPGPFFFHHTRVGYDGRPFRKAFLPYGTLTLVHFGDEVTPSGHLYLTRIPGIDVTLRNEIFSRIAANDVHYKPLPMMSAYTKVGFDIDSYPNAHAHYQNEITLPLHTCLTHEDSVITQFKKQLERVRGSHRGGTAMQLRTWEELPAGMQCDEVRRYYDILSNKADDLLWKRRFDVVMSLILIVVLLPSLVMISLAIALDSPGGVLFRQIRVTTNGRRFKIFKFRTMVVNAHQLGSSVTAKNDIRVTRVGRFLRDSRLDELPQLFNIIAGDMTFVGTRPEVVKYVAQYTPSMKATLLLPAGVTSEASIRYNDERMLLDAAENIDETYVNRVLPGKMYYNLKAIEEFGFFHEIEIMFRTVLNVSRSNKNRDTPLNKFLKKLWQQSAKRKRAART